MKHLSLIILAVMFVTLQISSAQQPEKYYFGKTVKGSFEEVTVKVKSALKKQGFGVVTEIDMDKTLREKLEGVSLRPYKILGVCNPGFAWETIQAEENIGLFLPCKVILKDLGNGNIEVVMVNPSVLMRMLGKKDLEETADQVTEKFRKALDEI